MDLEELKKLSGIEPTVITEADASDEDKKIVEDLINALRKVDKFTQHPSSIQSAGGNTIVFMTVAPVLSPKGMQVLMKHNVVEVKPVDKTKMFFRVQKK